MPLPTMAIRFRSISFDWGIGCGGLGAGGGSGTPACFWTLGALKEVASMFVSSVRHERRGFDGMEEVVRS